MQENYVLYPEPKPIILLSCWVNQVSEYDQIIGHSALGLFFVRNSATFSYCILHPLLCARKVYGPFPSEADFETTILQDEYFVDHYLLPETVASLSQRLGALEPMQVYIPQPYPFIGGSGALDTYDKGDVWVFAALVGQTYGL
jgi:hypothetical protein